MSPAPAFHDGAKKENGTTKSWKKLAEERKALKKQRKQDKLLKQLDEQANQAKEAEKIAETLPKVVKENPSTIAIAVPGSILENAQSAELRSYVAGQIARAACIFRVDEVIVFDDIGLQTARETKLNFDATEKNSMEDGGESRTVRSSSLQLARILQYLECPQYLRKFFFPLHKDLKYSGLLNPIDAPHHLRQQNIFPYREGIITDRAAKPGKSYANVGLLNDVLVNEAIEPGLRVTVKLDIKNDMAKKIRGVIVSPDEPRRETGIYWGYNVRIAHTFTEIFTKSPYDGGYDLSVGTSDRGKSVHDVKEKSCAYNHLLIIFGGIKGLQEAIANDDKLDVDDPEALFDHYLNVLPKQGSRTIRTEEAILVAMAALQEKLQPKVADVESDLAALLPQSEDTGITRIEFNKKNKKKRNHEDTEEPTNNVNNGNNDNEIEIANNVNEELPIKKKKKHEKIINEPTVDEVQEITTKKSKNKKEKKIHKNVDTINDDDFEVVTTDSKISSNKVVDTNLSRFD